MPPHHSSSYPLPAVIFPIPSPKAGCGQQPSEDPEISGAAIAEPWGCCTGRPERSGAGSFSPSPALASLPQAGVHCSHGKRVAKVVYKLAGLIPSLGERPEKKGSLEYHDRLFFNVSVTNLPC